MMERRREQTPSKLDRPWRRMAWVLPVSLCTWVAALMGFAMMLGTRVHSPEVAPLAVTLADMPSGPAGGSPGGGNGAHQGAGAPGPKAPPHPGKTGAAPPARTHHHVARHAPEHIAHRAKVSATRKHRREAVSRPARKIAEAHPIPRRVTSAPIPRAPISPAEDGADRRAATAPPDRGRERAAPAIAAAAPPAADRTAPPAPVHPATAALGPGGAGTGGGGSDRDGSEGKGGGLSGGAGAGPYTTVAHPPVAVYRVLPTYPLGARARGLEGRVVLRAVVDRNGSVEPAIEVVESVPMLDRAAIEALRQWRFEPARNADNQTVPVVIQVPLRFRLR